MRPKVIDLFAGVGGLSLGFEQQGFDVVLANEYDASIAAAYQQNHKNTKNLTAARYASFQSRRCKQESYHFQKDQDYLPQ